MSEVNVNLEVRVPEGASVKVVPSGDGGVEISVDEVGVPPAQEEELQEITQVGASEGAAPSPPSPAPSVPEPPAGAPVAPSVVGSPPVPAGEVVPQSAAAPPAPEPVAADPVVGGVQGQPQVPPAA